MQLHSRYATSSPYPPNFLTKPPGAAHLQYKINKREVQRNDDSPLDFSSRMSCNTHKRFETSMPRLAAQVERDSKVRAVPCEQRRLWTRALLHGMHPNRYARHDVSAQAGTLLN